MRRRTEEHDAAHRRRHVRGKRAHARRQRDFAPATRARVAYDDDGEVDDLALGLAERRATHQESVRKGAAGSPALL
jgi:hypothetical protein